MKRGVSLAVCAALILSSCTGQKRLAVDRGDRDKPTTEYQVGGPSGGPPLPMPYATYARADITSERSDEEKLRIVVAALTDHGWTIESMDRDAGIVTTSWRSHSYGTIRHVADVAGNKVTLWGQLNLDGWKIDQSIVDDLAKHLGGRASPTEEERD
ncbi:MAG: hypothetical protein ABIH26_11280 [Candidatus Eisenbacteria bacterium]